MPAKHKPNKKLVITMNGPENAPELLCGIYPRRSYVVDYGEHIARYEASYIVGQLVLFLFPKQGFMIYSNALNKRIDGRRFYTTSLDQVTKGVEELTELIDWDKFNEKTEEEKSAIYLTCNKIWAERFGAEFDHWNKQLARDIFKAVSTSKAITNSPL